MRVLLVTLPGDGHFYPLLRFAKALREAGHEALFATSALYVPDVRRTGFDAVGAGPDFRWDSAVERWPDCVNHMGSAGLAYWALTINQDVTVPLVQDLLRIIDDWKPSLVVAEYATTSAAMIVRECRDVPVLMTAWGDEPGSPTFLQHTALGLEPCRSAFGLGPWNGELPGDRWLAFTPKTWARVDGEPLPQTLRASPYSREESVARVEPKAPFVYATLGTIYGTTRKLLRAFIQALEIGKLPGLVTVGRNNDPSAYPHSVEVEVEQFVDQRTVLPRSSAVLCHGGFGTLMGALAEGVPSVVVPLGADQINNAEHVRRLRVGIVVEPAEATPMRLQEALQEVLSSSRYRAKCKELMVEIASMPSPASVVAESQLLD